MTKAEIIKALDERTTGEEYVYVPEQVVRRLSEIVVVRQSDVDAQNLVARIKAGLFRRGGS